MPTDLLIDIAAEAVAKYMLEGKYNHIDHQLPARPSNKVYAITFPQIPYLEEAMYHAVMKTQLTMLRPSKIDFSSSEYSIDDEDLEMIKKTNLVALKIGMTFKLKKYIKTRESSSGKEYAPFCRASESGEYFDIVGLLGDVLSENSKKELLKLNVSAGSEMHQDGQPLPGGWTQALGVMLPKLTTLKINERYISREDFLALCAGFPNLTRLDMNATGVNSLEGISQLQNLDTLSIGGLALKKQRDIEDLFQLRRIRHLKINDRVGCQCCKRNTIKFFAQSASNLPNLVILDCSDSDLTEDQLTKIIEKHPRLRQVIAVYTELEGTFPHPTVDVLTSYSLSQSVKTLTYFRKDYDSRTVELLLHSIGARIHQKLFDEQTGEGLGMAIREVAEIIQRNKHYERMIRFVDTFCHNLANPVRLDLIDTSDKDILIDNFFKILDAKIEFEDIDSSMSYIWKCINNLFQPRGGPQNDKIHEKASESLLIIIDKKMETHKKGLECLECFKKTLEYVKVTVEMKPEKKEKLVQELVKMKKEKTLKADHKRMADDVKMWIESNY